MCCIIGRIENSKYLIMSNGDYYYYYYYLTFDLIFNNEKLN